MEVKKRLFLLLYCCTHLLFGQTAFVKPGKAKSADEKIIVETAKDQKHFGKYLNKYGQPKILALGVGLNASIFLNQYPFLEEVSELVLRGKNSVDGNLLCEMASLSHLTIYVKENDSAMAAWVNRCSYITELTYVFEKDIEISPEWFALSHVKVLNVVGIFNKKQLENLLPMLQEMPNLSHLRLSTDFTRDLPEALLKTTQLTSFGMIDNLSFIQNQSFTDLAVEQYQFNYWDAENKQSKLLFFDYFSDRITLEDYDFNYLSKIFEDAQVLPYAPPAKEEVAVRNTNNDMLGNSAFSYFDSIDRKPRASLYFKLNPFIQSLDQNYVPAYEHFALNPAAPTAITTKKGFRITFPAFCLQTENGEMANQKVDIYFRLVQNPVEIAWSGFPLKYDSFNDYYGLMQTSICMLYASCNGVAVQLKAGFAIDIEMPNTGDRSFQLSEDAAFWYPTADLTAASLTRFKVNTFNDTFKPTPLADFASFNERYLNQDYYYLLDRNDAKVKIPQSLKASYTPNSTAQLYAPFVKGMVLENRETYLKPGRALIGVRKISFTDTARKNNTYFRIYRLIDKRLFPELKYFERYIFQYSGQIERKAFTKMLLRGKKFYDLRIVYEIGEKSGVLEIKYLGGYVQLPFDIVQKGVRKSPLKQIKAFEKRFAKYQLLLNKRSAYHQLHLQQYNQFLLDMQPSITGKKLLPIIAMGTYCLANLVPKTDLGSINLLINDPRGIPIDTRKIVIIYKEGFAMDYFFNKNNVSIDFSKEFAIIASDYKGNLYYITASACKGLKGGEGSVKSINSRLVDERIGTADLLLKSLGFSKDKK